MAKRPKRNKITPKGNIRGRPVKHLKAGFSVQKKSPLRVGRPNYTMSTLAIISALAGDVDTDQEIASVMGRKRGPKTESLARQRRRTNQQIQELKQRAELRNKDS